MTKFSLHAGLLAGLAVFFALSCTLPDHDSGSKGTLQLAFPPIERTIQPSDSSSYTIASYSISGTGPGSASFSDTDIQSTEYTRTGLAAGTWSIQLQGINSLGHTIATQTQEAAIIADTVTSLGFNPQRVAGSGTLSIAITWASPESWDNISATCRNVGTQGSPLTIDLVLAGDGLSVTGTKVLEAGDYLVSVNLASGGITVDSITEIFQIYADATTAGTFDKTIVLPSSTWTVTDTQPVYAVEFAGEQSVQIAIQGLAGKSLYLAKANTTDSSIPAASTGSATSQREVLPWSKAQRITAAHPSPRSDMPRVPRRQDHREAQAFNAKPPLPFTAPPKNRANTGRTVLYGEDPGLTLGASKTFYVQNAAGAWININATLQAIGDYCLVWVASDNFAPSSGSDSDNLLVAAQLSALRDRFDGTAALSNKDGIHSNVSTIFGYEYGGGTGGDGGLDGDQHVAILVYDIDYDYDQSQTGGVLGYFWSKDEYTQAQLDNWGQGSFYKSNEAEIFYVDSHFTDRYPTSIASTLIHEYQHMINYSNKYVVSGASSSSWFDELCSMVAEDLVCANTGLDPVADGAISRMPTFNYHYAESGVSDWLGGNDVLKSYASAFAFGAYLERNYGGAALFKAIAANNTVDGASITAALASLGYTETFESAFLRYGEALVFGDKPAGSDVHTFKQTVTTTIGGISYSAGSFDLADFDQSDLSSYTNTGTMGLRIYDTTEPIDLRPLGWQVQSRSAWQNPGTSITVHISAPETPGVKLYLMAK